MQYKTDTLRLQALGEWASSREQALQRLHNFAPRAGRAYARDRNYDFGPDSRHNVSVLSPYVRHRLVTEQELVEAALKLHGPSTAEKFIQEVCWRTYWKGWLERRPATWTRYIADVERLRAALGEDKDLADRIAAAEQGRTGIACFDAFVRELRDTGYLHNHARMWFASIWIFTLKLPWQLGADFFLSHLLDGDPASNTLSWRWVCGLHTTGKTYLARASNINDFTQGRFPLARDLAETADPLSDPLGTAPSEPIAPRQSVPRGDVLLLVGEDDLSPETLPFGGATVGRIAILRDRIAIKGHGQPYANIVAAFKSSGLTDANERAARHFWCPVQELDVANTSSAIAEIDHLATADTAVRRPIVMAEAPIGPGRDRHAALLSALAKHGHPVTLIRRDWDDAFWPHASRGFFNLKEKIPNVLRELGMAS